MTGRNGGWGKPMSSKSGIWAVGKQLLKRARVSIEGSKPAPANYTTNQKHIEFERIIRARGQFGRRQLGISNELDFIITYEAVPFDKRREQAIIHPEFASAVAAADRLLNPHAVPDQTKKLVFKSAEEQARDAEKARIRSLLEGVRDYGDDVLTDDFGAFLGAWMKLPASPERRTSLLRHPEFSQVSDNIERLRRSDAYDRARAAREHAERAACTTQEYFNDYMAGLEQEMFGNPNRILTHTDRRHLEFRHYAHYQRVAGTLSEKQRFLMLFIFGAEKVGIDGGRIKVDAFTSDMYRTCALQGGHGNNPRWEVDPDYNGDNEFKYLGVCKENAALDDTDEVFEQALSMSLNPIHTDDMLAVWVKNRLQPHSHGWATSR